MLTQKLTQRDRRLGPGPRSVHLVDIENLAGHTAFDAAEVARIAAEFHRTAVVASYDHVIVASSHFTAPPTWLGIPNARRLVRSGANGADLALLQVIDTEDLPRRFDRVVVGSGDGIFSEPVARLQAAGCAVTVVSRRGALSRQLRFAVRDVRYLDVHMEQAQVVRLSEVA